MIAKKQIQEAISHVSTIIVESSPELTRIDSIIGDGDHGTGMKRGFSAVYELLYAKSFASISDLLYMTGLLLIKKMGGASGVLFGSFFISGAKTHFENEESITLSEFAQIFQNGTDSIIKRGKAKLGDKTMLDALIPASHAFADSVNRGLSAKDCFENAYVASIKGANNTIEMKPKRGRAKNFQFDAVGYPDPGAISVTYIFRGFREVFSEK